MIKFELFLLYLHNYNHIVTANEKQIFQNWTKI